jgi:Domain of unknown function (DUF4280)
MAQETVMGAMMTCSFGTAPASLIVAPPLVNAGKVPAANILDFAPIANIPPFAMCTSIANPMVASATAAAMGVLTPMPCVPATAAPWVPGSPTVMVRKSPALSSTSKCMCMWAGVISITYPGQPTVNVP